MPAPLVAAPFILARVGLFLAAGAISLALAVLRNSGPDEKNDDEKKK